MQTDRSTDIWRIFGALEEVAGDVGKVKGIGDGPGKWKINFRDLYLAVRRRPSLSHR